MNKKFDLHIPEKAKVALVYRPDSSQALTLTHTLTSWLKDRGHQVFTAPEQKLIAGTKKALPKDLAKMNLVVVLGGDGTYLRAVKLLDGISVPVLGINMGSLGFLTPVRVDELFTAVEQTLKNQMQLQARSLIEVNIVKGKAKAKTILSLNDVVIERGNSSQLINISISAGKHWINDVKADGLIISTPTGSTAYNLAAGGPILHPAVRAFVITPIAAHSLTHRPLIFPADLELTFQLANKLQTRSGATSKGATARLVIDGVRTVDITPADKVTLKRSHHEHWTALPPDHNYFDLLREKLKFGGRI